MKDVLKQAIALLDEGNSKVEHARRLLDSLLETEAHEVVSPKEDILRRSAYLHLKFKEDNGRLTRGDSLAIRRELYGKAVQSTANQFGRGPLAGANFYRKVEYGTPIKSDQEVELTTLGFERAKAYRLMNDLP
jgi:hypothetical protein